MQKIQKTIEIVRSSTGRLSSMGQDSAEAIQAVLADKYSQVTITIVNNIADLEGIAARRPDLVFLGLKYIFDAKYSGREDSTKIWVSEYLDNKGIAYTGSNQFSHALEANKQLAKQQVHNAGFKTSPFHVIQLGDTFDVDTDLKFPLFVKPTNRGGGQGIDRNSVVHNNEELHSKVNSIANLLFADSLIEEFLPGREFSVAILRDETKALTAMPIELIAKPDSRGIRMLSNFVKSSNEEQVIAVLDAPLRARINDLAIGVFNALGARDYGRIDIRLDEDGVPHFLEANLIPSLISGYGSFPKACILNGGIEYKPMILSIAHAGMLRS
ncbi:MAG: D-alanine--D-alanine ligase [Candidatus Saccharimonadales bacterium]